MLCQQGLALAQIGRFAEAFRSFERALANPDITGYGRSALTAARIYTHARSGEQEKARSLVVQFEDSAIEPMHLSEAYAGLGDVAKVVEHLDRAFLQGGLKPLGAKCDPIYDTIRLDPAFQRFLCRLGLPD